MKIIKIMILIIIILMIILGMKIGTKDNENRTEIKILSEQELEK